MAESISTQEQSVQFSLSVADLLSQFLAAWSPTGSLQEYPGNTASYWLSDHPQGLCSRGSLVGMPLCDVTSGRSDTDGGHAAKLLAIGTTG